MPLETGDSLFVGVEFLGDHSKVGNDLCIYCVGGLGIFDVAIETVYSVAFIIIFEHLSNSVVFLNR